MADLNSLEQKKSELEKKISEIQNLSASGTQKILDAIKSQRWFFFENNEKIVFDRDTALIWANLDFFPYYCERYSNGDTRPYFATGSYKEVRDLMKKINSQRWGSFGNWEIPDRDIFWKMIEDKTFPFCAGGDWKIKNKIRWCVVITTSIFDGKPMFGARNLDSRNKWVDFDCHVLPYNHSIQPQNFSSSAREVLDIFSKNNLIPNFNNYEITRLYKKIFIDKIVDDKQKFLNQIRKIDNQIVELKRQEEIRRQEEIKRQEEERKKIEEENKKPKLTADFDYQLLLKKYNLDRINKSVVEYNKSILTLSDELLEILDEYENAQSETIGECSKIALKLSAKFIESQHLSEEENNLLEERQKFLAQRLELGTDEVKIQILAVKTQAEEFFARLEKINRGKNSIRELAELENEPRATFEFLVENLANIICDAQKKVDFFVQNKNFVTEIIRQWELWNEDYKTFKTNHFEELKNICRDENIEEADFLKWYADWQNKRFAIEEKFLPLAEFGLRGNLSDDGAIRTLKILQAYKDEVDKFYLHERKNIYQKFAFQAGGDLQEKFETESELYKLTEKLQRDLQKIIFSRENTEERIFLLRWAETLLNIPIDEITDFVKEKNLDAISAEVLTQFSQLKRRNFTAYLADSQAYGEAIKKREKDYNALIFRMRKDLNKK